MEKIDVLMLAVGIFGATAFFAISYCIKLHKCLYDVYNILNNHKDVLEHQNKINNKISNIVEGYKNNNQLQFEFNRSVINNISKLENKINIVANGGHPPFPTGGGEAKAEP